MNFKQLTKLTGRLLAGGLLLVILMWAGALCWNGWQLYQAARQGSALLQGGSLGADSLPEAGSALLKADRSLAAIRWELSPLLWLSDRMSGLPLVGPALAQLDPLVSYPTHLAHAGALLYQAISPLIENSAEPTVALNQRLFEALTGNPAAFQTAQAELQAAAAARQGFEPGILPQRWQAYIQKADTAMPYLQAGLDLLQRAPILLGGDAPQTYLVLAENQEELRATGGFITAIGTIQVAQGQLGAFNIGDSYAVDNYSQGYPAPPAPIKKFMLADYWVPRDGNWSPDFPSAAQEVQKLYQLSGDGATAGVLAFDESMVKAMLTVTGPIKLAGFAEPVSSANVLDFMHAAWAPKPEQGFSQAWWQNRKNFIPELGKAMIAQVLAMRDAGQLSALGHTLLSGLQQGHLEIYLNDTQAEAALAAIGLDGRVAPGSGDYLMLVDSNIGFNKADALMQRGLDYQVDLSNPSSPKAKVQMDYTNPVKQAVACIHKAYYDLLYSQMQARCYWDYWRVYTPAGDQLLQAHIQAVPAANLLDGQSWDGPVESYAGENGTQVLAGLALVPTQQSRQVGLQLSLPGKVVQADGNGIQYRLRVQKQDGLESLPLRVTVTAPAGMKLASGGAGWQPLEGQNAWSWSGTLLQTTDFALGFAPSGK